MSSTWSICPVVRDETIKLFDRIEVGGSPVEQKFLPFSTRVLWIRESETKIVLRHDDIEIKVCATFNDFYGFLTSLENAITDEVPKMADRLKIGFKDRLAIELDVAITDTPVLPDNSEEARRDDEQCTGKRHRKSYLPARAGREGDRPWFLSDKPWGYSSCPVLEAVTVYAEEAIFSTRTHSTKAIARSTAQWIAERRAEAEDLEKKSAAKAGGR